jgi:hypothetical protein
MISSVGVTLNPKLAGIKFNVKVVSVIPTVKCVV